jgi:molecular chaperone DnaJ
VLGVARDASQKAIRDAFRELALKHHPDRNKEAGAEERFKEIAEAYAILSDPKKRADYDARGFAGVAGFSREDLFGGINFEDIFGGLGFDFGGGSPFEGFFHRRRAGPARGANIELDITVPLERVATGGEEVVELTRPVTCPACHGTGEEGGATPPPCEACHGSGRITHSRRDDKEHVLFQQISTCPACHGRGSKQAHPCPQCQGRGEVAQAETLTVRIPVGVEEGLALRIAGKGQPSPEPGGVAGDLFVVVRSRPDARFERMGADLLRQETIALTDAVLGTRLEVPTLDGSASVTVPPGTQPQAVLRLKKKGLPAFGGGPRGDLYLRIGVQVPERLTPPERALYEQLRALGRQSPSPQEQQR